MESTLSMSAMRSTSANPTTIELSSMRGWRADHSKLQTSILLQIWDGTHNMCVKAGQSVRGFFVRAGQSVGGCFDRLKQKLKLLGERRRGETIADNTNNTLNLQRQPASDGSNDIRIDIGNVVPENPPNNNLQRQSASDNNAGNNILRGHSTISKILCAANLVLIVAIVFVQISKPTHPYRWIAIVELSVQSAALVAMMLGFYLEAINLSAAMWFHRTGHLLFLEGIAVAAVYRFHWPLRFIPLVLLPVPIVLIPVYILV